MVNVNKKWAALIAVALSTFLISLDSTFMNVAINSLVIDLNTTVSTVQLIITFYTFITITSITHQRKRGNKKGRME